jgi:hypothetical protein
MTFLAFSSPFLYSFFVKEGTYHDPKVVGLANRVYTR